MSTYPTSHDDLTCPNARGVAALRKRVEELTQALGLLTTIAGDVVVDSDNPLRMAQEIVASVEARREGESKAVAKLHDLLSGAVSALDPDVDGPLVEAIFAVLHCGLDGRDDGPCAQYARDLDEAEKRGAERERWECHRIAERCKFERAAQVSSMSELGNTEAVAGKAAEAHRIAGAIAARGSMRGPEEER